MMISADKVSVVIGGSGFLGKVLVTELKRAGHYVINIDINYTETQADEFVQSDILALSEPARKALLCAQNVIHLAAHQFNKSIPKYREHQYFFDTNVGGTRNILSGLAQSNTLRHFLFVSTDMTYGVPERSPIDETHPTRPLGPYGASKREAEKLIETNLQGKCAWTIFRPRLILGPGRLGVMIKLFKLISSGGRVPVIGRGNTRYQMISVFDCARAIRLAIEKGCSGVFNLGSDNPPRVKELLSAVIDHAGTKARLFHLPERLARVALDTLYLLRLSPLYPEQYRIASVDYLLDTSKAKNMLGWQAEFRDEQMMNDAYDYYKSLGKNS